MDIQLFRLLSHFFPSDMTNQQLMDQGNQLMDETDQAIARSKQVNLLLWQCLFMTYSYVEVSRIMFLGTPIDLALIS